MDETIITSGKSDYFDILKIVQSLKTLQIKVILDPTSPYDEIDEQWRTDKVLIYVCSDIRSKTYMINVIHGVCETYF